jgi:dTDP-4-dehydrorhamnose 3,5-epimerase
MNITPLAIPDILMIEPKRFGDDRGFFSEVFNERTFHDAGIDHHWVQDNHAKSVDAYVLRGLHFQALPHAQAKLIRVAEGSVFDVVVDLRAGSSTYGKSVSAILSADAWNQLFVPAGFAHGYLTLEPYTEVLYKVDDYYTPECEGGVIWNDPDLDIDWPLNGHDPVLSGKDQHLPRLKDLNTPFSYD